MADVPGDVRVARKRVFKIQTLFHIDLDMCSSRILELEIYLYAWPDYEADAYSTLRAARKHV